MLFQFEFLGKMLNFTAGSAFLLLFGTFIYVCYSQRKYEQAQRRNAERDDNE